MTEVGIKEKWLDLIYNLALRQDPDRVLSTGIKYFGNVQFSLTGDQWRKGFNISLPELGYGGRSTKMTQLSRNYRNVESLTSAREKLSERLHKKSAYSSVMATMTGDKKDSRSQGHCMSSTVITHNPKDYITGEPTVFVDIHYRVTEVIKKFGADLIFFNKVIIPEMLPDELSIEDINGVRFHFANIYLSPLFLPILVPQMDVIDLVNRIDEEGPFETLRGCYNALATLTIEDMEHYSYRSRRHMHQFLCDAVGEDKYLYLDLLNKLYELNPGLKYLGD